MKTENLISGALYDFFGFLTTRIESTSFGSSENSEKALDLLVQFAENRGIELTIEENEINEWQDHVKETVVAKVISEDDIMWEIDSESKNPAFFDVEYAKRVLGQVADDVIFRPDACECGQRAKKDCEETWGPKCDMGNNPDHVKASTLSPVLNLESN